MKIKKNISKILNESYRWRNRNLLEEKGFSEPEEINFLVVLKRNLSLIIFGVILALLFGSIFNNELAGYTITALSIFIGLFLSVLILIFDKFLVTNNLVNSKSSDELLVNVKRTKNFTRRFVFVSLESLLIATVLLILLLLPLMMREDYVRSLFDYKFSFENITFKSVLLLIENTIILLSRVLIVIFTYKFFKYLFFIFGSLGEFMKGVLDEKTKI